MKLSKKLFSILLALSLLFCAGCATAGETPSVPTSEPTPTPDAPAAEIPQDNLGYGIGMTLPDFSFTTFDGKTMSLYGTLAEKDLVLINIWATWCGPCGMEFPFMEEAYQQYKDEVEIFALSCEPSDDDAKLAEYVADMGMSFPVGSDEAELAVAFMAYSIPTTIVVDRFGTVCAIEVGAKSSAEAFTGIFESYLGEDYEGYVDPNAAPVCDVAPSTEAELAEALNVEGGELSFTNIDNEHVWPMVYAEKDSRQVLRSSNQSVSSTASVISTKLSAKAGDALAINFAISSEQGLDLMKLYVNGVLVKSFGGEYDWTSYAYAFEADGEYDIFISYEKNGYTDMGEDTLWLDSVELLSGEAAEAALKANPRYVYGEETLLVPTNPSAREIVFDDPQSVLTSADDKDSMSFYIIPEEDIRFLLTLAPGLDPEPLLFLCDYDVSVSSILSNVSDKGYEFASGVDSMESTGYPYSMLYLEDISGASGVHKTLVYFASEENVNAFVRDYLTDSTGNALVSWKYADGSLPSTELAAGGESEVSYTVRYTDQNGAPVAGVTLQVCDESICQVYVSDENGECSFSLPPYPYELHTLLLPEGYEGDTESVTLAPTNGGEVSFSLNKK